MMATMILAAGDGGVDELLKKFGWEPQLFISQLVLFVIVAGVLTKFAYKPLLEVLEQRKRQIAEAEENGKKTREALASAQADARKIVNDAGQQANKIIEEARAAAASEREKSRQQAVADAQDILAKAKAAGEAELVRLKGELRQEFGRLVVQASLTATAGALTTEQRQKIAEDSSRSLSA
jgi:F-type H+-transporting ATPase subunit b